jgi:hypothetical protein
VSLDHGASLCLDDTRGKKSAMDQHERIEVSEGVKDLDRTLAREAAVFAVVVLVILVALLFVR